MRKKRKKKKIKYKWIKLRWTKDTIRKYEAGLIPGTMPYQGIDPKTI